MLKEIQYHFFILIFSIVKVVDDGINTRRVFILLKKIYVSRTHQQIHFLISSIYNII